MEIMMWHLFLDKLTDDFQCSCCSIAFLHCPSKTIQLTLERAKTSYTVLNVPKEIPDFLKISSIVTASVSQNEHIIALSLLVIVKHD